MNYLKEFELFNENFAYDLETLNDIDKRCEFRNNVYYYLTIIDGNTIECFAYDNGTKFDYSVNNSYNINTFVKLNNNLKILNFVKNAVYHHLIKHQPDFLFLKAQDKNRKFEKKKLKIYNEFLINIPSLIY